MAARAKTKKIFFIGYFTVLHVLLAFFVYEKIIDYGQNADRSAKDEQDLTAVVPLPSPISIPNEETALPPLAPTPTVAPTPENTPLAGQRNDASNIAVPENAAGRLMIPVVGVKTADLQDTYTQSRSGGRVHNAIDIMAPGGTPVVAAADGEIVKFFDSKLGGITIYQLSADKKFIYYYAHLQRRADNLQEKTFVRQGTIIGYVGDTGNSGAGNYHLHFSITIPNDPNRYWDGTEINPYPILKQGIEAKNN